MLVRGASGLRCWRIEDEFEQENEDDFASAAHRGCLTSLQPP